MISKHDIKGDGVLSYEEFKCIFFDKTSLEPDEDDPWQERKGPTVDSGMV